MTNITKTLEEKSGNDKTLFYNTYFNPFMGKTTSQLSYNSCNALTEEYCVEEPCQNNKKKIMSHQVASYLVTRLKDIKEGRSLNCLNLSEDLQKLPDWLKTRKPLLIILINKQIEQIKKENQPLSGIQNDINTRLANLQSKLNELTGLKVDETSNVTENSSGPFITGQFSPLTLNTSLITKDASDPKSVGSKSTPSTSSSKNSIKYIINTTGINFKLYQTSELQSSCSYYINNTTLSTTKPEEKTYSLMPYKNPKDKTIAFIAMQKTTDSSTKQICINITTPIFLIDNNGLKKVFIDKHIIIKNDNDKYVFSKESPADKNKSHDNIIEKIQIILETIKNVNQEVAKNKAATKAKGGSNMVVKTDKIKTPTKERIMYKGRNRVVYVGPRGGKYILSKDEFISCKKLKMLENDNRKKNKSVK